ncbi:hypothetical protein [Luteibacter sp. 3190]|uniref:hypothetical protein n=1 Tax=Luteibacter sp. 3190 TaxID=2817736 RepID=UPI002860F26D|nr:hypothetical protein [Luteibacter sp. 3190]MDR6936854.1 hypothetical protein [Luteibacter sp. 3190]
MNAKISLVLVLGLLAACGRTMCEIPAEGAGSGPNGQIEAIPQNFSIVDYGPRAAKINVAFNQQPDGSSAMWFKLNEDVQGTMVRVHIGASVIRGDIARDVVTIKVPSEILTKEGSLIIYLEKFEGRDISRSDTVKLEVSR